MTDLVTEALAGRFSLDVVDGLRIAASTQTSRSGDPLIVFVHGFGGSLFNNLPTAKLLVDDFDCILTELPGHGRSREPSSWTSERIFLELTDLLRSVTQDRDIYFVGHSLGGGIAANLRLNTHERIIGLTAVSGAFFEISDFMRSPKLTLRTPWATSVLAGALATASSQLSPDFIRRLDRGGPITNFLWPYLQPGNFQPGSGQAFAFIEQGGSSAVRDLRTFRSVNLFDAYIGSRLPMLFVLGGQDPLTTAADRARLRTMPSSSVLDVPGVAHWAQVERPFTVASAIRAHISKHRFV